MALGGFKRALHWVNLVVALVLGIALWGIIVLVASEPRFKVLWDLSPQAIGTVSPLTEQLIAELRRQDRVAEFHMIRFTSMSGQTEEEKHLVRLRQTVQQQTWDLLQQYSALGGASVQVRGYAPGVDDDSMRQLTEQFPVPGYGAVVLVLRDPDGERLRHKVVSIEHDLADIDSGERLSGMAPGSRPLPQLRGFLGEQVLSSRLKELMVTGRPKVYFLSGYHISDLLSDGTGDGYAALASLLERDGIDVEPLTLRPGEPVPGDASAVALMEPDRPVPDEVADALQSFVRDGGRLLVNFAWSGVQDKNIEPDNLGSRFGFTVGRQLVCRRIPDPLDPSGPGRVGIPTVTKHFLLERNLNGNHPITRPFALDNRSVGMDMAREVARRTDVPVPEGMRPDPSLVMSDPMSWLEGGRAAVDFEPPGGPPQGIYSRRSLGMVIDVDSSGSGPRDPEDEGGDEKSATDMADGHVVVLGGRMLSGIMLAQNRDFALSLFNWLTRRDVLVAVRAREYRSNRMEVGPQQLDRLHRLVVMGVPGGLLLLCIVVLWRRSR